MHNKRNDKEKSSMFYTRKSTPNIETNKIKKKQTIQYSMHKNEYKIIIMQNYNIWYKFSHCLNLKDI